MSYGYDDQDMLNSDDKRVAEARGHLSKIFRQFLVALDIDGWKWDRYMRIFLTDPRNGIPNNSRDKSSARGNLNKELKRDDMTWRVFLKAMSFLDPVRVTFTVKATFKNGKTLEVSSRIKDRGQVELPHNLLKQQDQEEQGNDDTGMDEVDEMSVTEHRPTLRNKPTTEPFTATDVINAINGKSNR